MEVGYIRIKRPYMNCYTRGYWTIQKNIQSVTGFISLFYLKNYLEEMF